MSVRPPLAWVGKSQERAKGTETTRNRYVEVIAVIKELQAENKTRDEIADILNRRGERTFRGLH